MLYVFWSSFALSLGLLVAAVLILSPERKHVLDVRANPLVIPLAWLNLAVFVACIILTSERGAGTSELAKAGMAAVASVAVCAATLFVVRGTATLRLGRFQFSLATLLASFVVFAVVFGWVSGRIVLRPNDMQNATWEVNLNGEDTKYFDLSLPSDWKASTCCLVVNSFKATGPLPACGLDFDDERYQQIETRTLLPSQRQSHFAFQSSVIPVSAGMKLRVLLRAVRQTIYDVERDKAQPLYNGDTYLVVLIEGKSPGTTFRCGDDSIPLTTLRGTTTQLFSLGRSRPGKEWESKRIVLGQLYTIDDAGASYVHEIELRAVE